MRVEREVSFEDVWQYVVQQIPEADPAYVVEFLRQNSRPPYTLSSRYHFVREIEKLMYL